jgi:hypothetical protein
VILFSTFRNISPTCLAIARLLISRFLKRTNNIDSHTERVVDVGESHRFIHFRVEGFPAFLRPGSDKSLVQGIHLGRFGHLDGKFRIARVAARVRGLLGWKQGQLGGTHLPTSDLTTLIHILRDSEDLGVKSYRCLKILIVQTNLIYIDYVENF